VTRYAEGALATFLLRLDERQAHLTEWALAGPTLVKGGPGSGKSTVALYRVRSLVKHHMAETGQVPSVLFTTYTNALTSSSQLLHQLLRDELELKENGRLPAQIRITTLHKTAVWIAKRSGQSFQMASPQQRQKALDAARATLQPHGLGDAAMIPTADIMAAVPDFDDEALRQEYLHAGLPPVLYAAEGSEAQARWIARQIVGAA
jgi:superfamily I DNA/RNA helicase